MSIATEIERIKSAKAAIKDAINAKGGTLTDELLGAYADAVAALPSGGGSMEFYKCAAVYGPRKVTCVTVSGCPNASVNGDYLPTEFYVEDWEGNKHTVYSNGTYYYYFNAMDNQWCIGTDYNSYSYLYFSWGTNMASTGWNYSNWEPVEGMSSSESEITVDTDVPKTWDGYKAVLSNGIYNFESELTTGMSYTDVKPENFKVYSADVTVKIASLPRDFPTDKLVFYAPLCGDVTATEVGETLKNRNVSLETVGGIQAARFVPTATLNTTAPLPIDCKDTSEEFSVFFCINPSAVINEAVPICIGSDSYPVCAETITDGGSMYLRFYTNVNNKIKIPFSVGSWYNVTMVRKDGTLYVYNGKTFFDSEEIRTSVAGSQLVLGAKYINDSRYNFNGYMRNILIYNRALSEAEIAQLNDKFAIGEDNESGDGGGSGEGDGNAYVYTVSGAGDADANGNYYDSGMTDPAGHHIYTNDKCTLCLWIESSDSSGYRWIITRSADEQELYSSYTIGEPTMSSHTWGVVFGAEPAPTVTEYSGDSGSGDGNDDDGNYRIRVSGNGVPPTFLGMYSKTNNTTSDGGEIWENSEAIYLFYADGYWRLGAAYDDPGTFYSTQIASDVWMQVGTETVVDAKTVKIYGGLS